MPVTGIDGSCHQSAAEAKASFALARYGITRCDDYYPETFHDSDCKPYRARSDFIYEPLQVRIEFKDSARLNGLKTLANADKALHRFHVEEARGYITAGNRQKKMLDSAWSESIHKLAGVVKTMTVASVILIRSTEPDEKEHRRLTKQGVFYRTIERFAAFGLFCKLASFGLAVTFQTDEHTFSVETA